jgi:putative CocE/NonD family hydrolase
MTPDVIDKYEQTLPSADFIRRDAMVPMRDGTKLYTVTVMKKGAAQGPILLSRTPYDAHHSTHRVESQRIGDILEVMDAEFVEDGYIRVYQDIRGLHRSEGAWVLNRPLAGPVNDTGIDESTDAYDTIDWLVKNTPESNGKVGIIGSIYLGFTTLMAESTRIPHSRPRCRRARWSMAGWAMTGSITAHFASAPSSMSSACLPRRAKAAANSRSERRRLLTFS